MSLRGSLDEDLKAAMRAKDSLRLSVIRSVKAGILQAETRNQRTTLDDEGILQVLVKEVKERQDSMTEFERAKRPDLVDQLRQEISVLQTYLPAPLTPTELSRLIDEAMAETGAEGPKDMGRVMGWLTLRTRGRADGKAVAEAVSHALRHRSG